MSPRWIGYAASAAFLLLACDPYEETAIHPATEDTPAAPHANVVPPTRPKPPRQTASNTHQNGEPQAPPQHCPGDMELVAGNFCPVTSQRCIQRGDPAKGDPSDHCKRYAKAECLSNTREPLRFCMDRYEWPNLEGEKPLTLVSWTRARALCSGQGKRLCTADEFTFACEGEAMTAHVYGNERDNTVCHFDQKYIHRSYTYLPWDECMAETRCRQEHQRLDQRLPAGTRKDCVSPHGIYDLNGNINEWVMRPQQTPPHRSGLKGGWWGPVRNRCRPMTTFHPEHDYGYEAGFRCCADSFPSRKALRNSLTSPKG